MKTSLYVERWGVLGFDGRVGGDFLNVGPVALGGFRDLAGAEFERCKGEHPENPAYYMRPMFHTGSPFGKEILDLAQQVRPEMKEEVI